jgi:uncharacterized membrane protein YccF (DUF307 family)
MRTIGNALWLVLAGWWVALGYALAGVLACLLVVTIPFGLAAFRLAGYALWPFGRRVIVHRQAGALALVGNVLWIALFGWELAVAHVVAGLLLMLTVVGIPFGLASIRLAGLAFVPLGARVVAADSRLPDYRMVPANR